ncbi:MAG: hypothetical protein AAGA87_14295 [Pseudomonadota bacterium]
MKRLLAAAAMALCTITGAQANHYMQRADPQVLQAINDILYALGQGCSYGNVNACNLIPVAQQQAHAMLVAGYDCRERGNQQACSFYEQNLWQLQEAYQQVAYAAQTGLLYSPTGGQATGNPLGQTHAQRMQNIHNWGQQRLEYGRQSQQLLDQRHEQFMKNF